MERTEGKSKVNEMRHIFKSNPNLTSDSACSFSQLYEGDAWVNDVER